jgi:drug/metabolite transporter (DMT)-like permease
VIYLRNTKQETDVNSYIVTLLFALLAGICGAIGVFSAKFWMKDTVLHPVLAFAIRETVTFIGVWIIVLPVALKQLPELWAFEEGRQSLLAIALFSGLIGSLIGHVLLFYALKPREVNLSIVMVLTNAAPIWATTLAILFRQESFSWVKMLGILVTIIGVAIVLYSQ